MKPFAHFLPLAWLLIASIHAAPAATEPAWETLLPQLGDAKVRREVRTTLAKAQPYPATALVSLLQHPQLAVRLGALELLEERAGGDFAFDPWLEAGSTANQGPLDRWRQWAGGPPTAQRTTNSALLSDDQRRGYLRDLLGNDDNQAARARHMLEADGIAAAGFLEEFLRAQPSLPPGSRAKVREAQYQIVLAPRLAGQAVEVARHLAFGSRDQLLSAIGVTRNCGPAAIPILRDFLGHTDSLVRETTIDALLAAGGAAVVPVVAPALRQETDVNVIHGAMRRLKDVPGGAASELAAAFLDHEDEDLLVSALQTCLSLAGGSHSDPFARSRGSHSTGGTQPADRAVLVRMTDPRWRVRVAALEYIGARKLFAAKDGVLKLLDDPDEFVRFAAIKAASTMQLKEALPPLKAKFLRDEAMIGPVLEGYAALDMAPDADMLDHLTKLSPEARIAAVRAAESDADLAPLVKRFAEDADLDVACAALRFLAADDDRTVQQDTASILVRALRSGSAEKRTAVLDRLQLPKSATPGDMALLLESAQEPGKPTALDPMYDALLAPLAHATTNAAPESTPNMPAAQAALIAELTKIATQNAEPESRFRAALALARAGNGSGFKTLTQLLPTLSTAQKAAIGDELDDPSHRDAIPLLLTLLRDPVSEIRQAAASAALSDEDATAFIKMVLDELRRPGTPLLPHEIYSYRFESCVKDASGGRVMRQWAATVLKPQSGDGDPLRVLACLCLRHQHSPADAEMLLALTQGTGNPNLRRAAWHALGYAKSPHFSANVKKIAHDTSPHVRAVVAAVANRSFAGWQHRFDDLNAKDEAAYDYSSRNAKTALPLEWTDSLQDLAAPTEVADTVRYEAMFALMAAGKAIDVAAMAALLPRQPESGLASHKLASWFSSNSAKVGPVLRPLFEALDKPKINAKEMQALQKRLYLGGTEGPALTTFDALAANHNPQAAHASQQAATDESIQQVERESLPVVFFHKPGCRECAQARELMQGLKRDFPTLVVTERNILDAKELLLNEALSARFQVTSAKRHIAPAIFTQGGALIREEITPQSLALLLAKTAGIHQNDDWMTVDSGQIESAREEVSRDYQALTLPVVIGAGLLDGVNPCAFATIIFFLSYLQIARRTPREMLLTGAAFIAGVFIAYFAAGMVLYEILAALHEKFAGIQRILTPVFAALALLAAGLSFRDAMRARAGRLDEMSLQLPDFLKDRIRGVIRTGARARRFIMAAFLAGIAISLLELACTGQVYAPIVYQIQQGKLDAVGMLLLYNLAFILPLVVIFLLAYGGLRSESLIRLQQRHTFAVKLALGLLFVVLAAFILFGSKLLGGHG